MRKSNIMVAALRSLANGQWSLVVDDEAYGWMLNSGLEICWCRGNCLCLACVF